MFNFVDVSFQLMAGPMDKNIASLLVKMNELRKYYDRKSTLNCNHNEIIIDLFRTCVRKDTVLSSTLESNFEGYFDKSDGIAMDVVDNSTMQDPSIDVSGQSRIERLCNVKSAKSTF
jgi:hypothetical protein